MKTISNVKLLIDLGMQPISSRYLQNPAEKEELFPFKLGQCQETGLIQLIDPVPYKELVPRFDWLTNYEPEGHLDSLVDKISKLLFKKEDSIIAGISTKDVSMLERFERLGFHTWKIDSIRDLKLEKNVGIESIQAELNIGKSKKIVDRNDKADLLVARHIWEHAYNQEIFSEALKELITEDGYIYIEVTFYSNFIDNFDYTMPWEEHLHYYTPFTFKQSLLYHGFEVHDLEVIPFPYKKGDFWHDASMFALVRKQGSIHVKNVIGINELEEAIQNGDRYARKYRSQKKMIVEKLNQENRKREIILFGAGHSSSAFINHFSLGGLIECLIDENKYKQGLFMPKSGLPIVHSQKLYEHKSALCLLAVSPIHEEKILSKHKRFMQEGGEFRSICPWSKYSIYR